MARRTPFLGLSKPRPLHRRTGVTMVLAAACACACYQSYRIESDGDRDAHAEGHVDDGRTDVPRDDGADDVAEDVGLDAGSGCPVWAAPEATVSGGGSGTPERPFAGLQRAVDGRGTCGHIVLRHPDGDPAFGARVDIALDEGEHLLVETDPAAEAPAELDAAGAAGLVVTGAGSSLTLYRLAVRGGRARQGACLRAGELGNEPALLRLEETSWQDCRADYEGGAVWAVVRDVHIADSTFMRNYAESAGGAVNLDGPSTATIEGSDFGENEAGVGGALTLRLFDEGQVSGCRFTANRATERGGAIKGMFRGTLLGCRFDRNEASQAGAAWISSDGEFRIAQNAFFDNSADVEAALSTSTAGLILENNLFVRNRGSGGAFLLGAGTDDVHRHVYNNTFVDNEAAGPAHLTARIDPQIVADIFVGGRGSGSVRVGYGGSDVAAYDDSWNVPWPAFDGGVVEFANISADPLFRNASGDDFRLAPGSPCIDAGDPAAARNDPDGTRNDIGAFGGPEGDWTPLDPF
jgi:hypothetical protein